MRSLKYSVAKLFSPYPAASVLLSGGHHYTTFKLFIVWFKTIYRYDYIENTFKTIIGRSTK
jgi:hypothetical protein